MSNRIYWVSLFFSLLILASNANAQPTGHDNGLTNSNMDINVSITAYPGQFISSKEVEEIQLSLIFNQPITNFSINNLLVIGAEITSLTGSDNKYLVVLDISQLDEGVVEFYIKENPISEHFGIQRNEWIEYFIYVDKTPPKINLTVNSINKATGIIKIDLSIDDPVFNFNTDPIGCFVFNGSCFTQEDIIVEGGEIQNFNGNLGAYLFDLIPASRNVEIYIPEDVAFNGFNIGNSKSNVLHLTYPDIVLGADEENNLTPLHHWIDNYNFLNVKIEGLQSSADIFLVDISGRTIIKSVMNGPEWKENMNGIKTGVYILYITSGNWIEKSKIIIK